MPEMDGMEATRTIRLHEKAGRHVPIIAVTAHAMTGYREVCLEAGMDDHMAKPFSLKSLAETLARHSPVPASAVPGESLCQPRPA